MADVLLLECTLMLEEKFCGILADFPNIKVIFLGLFGCLPTALMQRKHNCHFSCRSSVVPGPDDEKRCHPEFPKSRKQEAEATAR